MTIDLSRIDYAQFQFVLNSDVEIENIYTDENTTDDKDITVDKEGNDISININKEELNFNKIVLYYQIPENIEIGTKIQLNAQVIISENNGIDVVDEKQIEITIVEENEENEENENLEDTVNKEQQCNQQVETVSENSNQNSMQNTQGLNSNKISTSQNISGNSSTTKTSDEQIETATYNGSNNNYLTSLEIDGIQLTTEFNKERLTYFATVENLSSITVTAEAEDSSSKISITGTELKSGENKVLISVTAENGDVRYYRIYVINN